MHEYYQLKNSIKAILDKLEFVEVSEDVIPESSELEMERLIGELKKNIEGVLDGITKQEV